MCEVELVQDLYLWSKSRYIFFLNKITDRFAKHDPYFFGWDCVEPFEAALKLQFGPTTCWPPLESTIWRKILERFPLCFWYYVETSTLQILLEDDNFRNEPQKLILFSDPVSMSLLLKDGAICHSLKSSFCDTNVTKCN